MKFKLFQSQSQLALTLAAIGMVGFGLTATSANAQAEILAIEFNEDDQEGFDLWPTELVGTESIAEFPTDAVATSGTTTVTLTTNTGLSRPVNRGSISDGNPDGFTYTNLYQDLLHAASPTGFIIIQFSGLNPDQNYQFTLYAWDPGATDSSDKEWTVTAGIGDPAVASVNFQDPLVDNESFGLVFDITTTSTGTFQLTNTDGLPQSAINGFTLVSSGPPLGITEVSVDAPTGTSTITWNAVVGQQYSVEGSLDLLSWKEVANILGESDSMSYTLTGDPLTAPPMQYWRVGKVDAPPFLETSFEDGLGSWSVSGEGTLWEFGTPTSGPGAANTGVGVAATGLADDYADGTAVQLRTPVIDPGETTRVTLEFWYYLQAAQGDGGQISLLEADGTLIQNLERLYLGGEDDTTEWAQENLRLTLEPARAFIVQFAFLSVDDGQPNNGLGWLLDDVRIGK